MPIEHLAPSASAEQVAELLERDGCVIVAGLARRGQLARLREEIAPYLEATPLGHDDFSGRRTRRTGGLVARSPAARELVADALVLGAVERVLSRATRFQLHLTQMIAIGPGEPAQPIHRDQWAFDFFPFPKGYEIQCNTIWAVTDFTASNGATRVIPGSHRYDDRLSFRESDSEPAEMEAGSVLFYTGSLYHGGGANRSEAVRLGCNITYTAAWLRQEENQYLSVPWEIARDLPEPLLRLIGYARGAYALGYVDDLRDPMEVLRPGAGHAGLGDLARAAEKVAPGRPATSKRSDSSRTSGPS